VAQNRDWEFISADFRQTFNHVNETDFVYLDPPYAGRHVDYYNSWNAEDENSLATLLSNHSTKFLLSTWHSNKYRSNPNLELLQQNANFHLKTQAHFYHVGATEDHRNFMTEALVSR
jgi:DNA adenine methylase